MLDPIINFLGGVLSLCYQVFPNVGLAIILLTVIINLALFPLTLKQTRSMKAMQEIQPLVKDLQKKHKDDRQKLNEEMVALYKERNVNPAAGCLPMILQIPIWWSLFSLLRSFGSDDPTSRLPDDSNLAETVLEGGTDFLGMDLIESPASAVQDGISGAIPYLLLVVFIVVTGYYQQAQLTKRRAKSGQQIEETPQQRQMQTFTKVLPVVFGFISYSLLAGVDLYIAAGQVVRIGQQALIFRLDEGRGSSGNGADPASPPPDTEPPAEEAPPEEAPPKKTYQGSKKKQQQRRRRRS